MSLAALTLHVSDATAQASLGVPAGSPFLGGVPQGAVTAAPLTLTLVEVVTRALDHNLGVLAAEQAAARAAGSRTVALSALLPSVDGSVTETRRKTNLEAFGFPLGPDFPRVVGPFNVFDARVSIRQALFDRSLTSQARAGQFQVLAARHAARNARELVVLVSANAYLESLAAAARVEAADAQVATATALYREAQNLKSAGLVAGLDVVRAEVRMISDQQSASAARTTLEKTRLQLARLAGLPVGQTFSLSETLPAVPLPQASFDEVLSRAQRTREDLLAAEARVQAADATVRAMQAERLPTVSVTGDYGAIGLTPGSALSTFSVTGAVQVPLFDGGRTRGHVAQAQAELTQRRAELEDLRAAVYYGTRAAFLDLAQAQEQVSVADRGRALADLQLVQARDRFAAGVTSNIEVVQAQEAVAAAAERAIAALHDLNVAKALILSAAGTLEETLHQSSGSANR